VSEEVRRRLIERHCAATIRALSQTPEAEYRRQRLFLSGKCVPLIVPHLAVDVIHDSIARNRGVADSIALRLLYSDSQVHLDNQPAEGVARLVFEILEQLRCESIAPYFLTGIRINIDEAFNQWCRESRGNGLVENELGLLIYSITQIARSRLSNAMQDEEVEGLIESVRFRLGPVIGDDLAMLYGARFDQKQFAIYALGISEAINEMSKALGGDVIDKHLSALRSRNLLPPANEEDEKYVESEDAQGRIYDFNSIVDEGYRVYCREFDKQVNGSDLYRLEQRQDLRVKLDQLVAAQAISVSRLAQRLKYLFAVSHQSGWHEGEEEGYIDGRRLSQIVTQPGYTRVFKKEQNVPRCDTAVSFLIDNSGSMKRQRFEAVAVLVDIYSRALELAGVTTEILGFTTGGWAGGESVKVWRKDGFPEDPGRLNEQMHIVYKNAETSWRRSRFSTSSLLNPIHFKEGLDGEALQWAANRLVQRPESRKCLVMISDGAPMETATSNYNGAYYLESHLKNVVTAIERSGLIELRAIGIALDMEEFFREAVTLDLTGTLGNTAFKALELLFSNSRDIGLH
jgi:cobaltochelatase CobT